MLQLSFFLENTDSIYGCWNNRDVSGRDVGSISNLGGTVFRGHVFLKKKGAFSKNGKGTSLFIPKSLGHVRPVPPIPTSMVS